MECKGDRWLKSEPVTQRTNSTEALGNRFHMDPEAYVVKVLGKADVI